MTVLVGVIQDGQTYIGTDGYATTEDCERKHIICRKLFVNGPYVIAFAGHIRTGQLLYPESGFEMPEDIYMIPNAMYLWLREFEVIGKDESQMGMIASNFLILREDKMYSILMDMQISEIDPELGYTAIGGGCPFALGSLYTSTNYKDPKKRILTALDAASEFHKGCGRPYSIYSYAEAIAEFSVQKPKKKRKTRTKKAKS